MTDKPKITKNAIKIIMQKGVCDGVKCVYCPCNNPYRLLCNVSPDSPVIFDPLLTAVAICEQWLKDNPEKE